MFESKITTLREGRGKSFFRQSTNLHNFSSQLLAAAAADQGSAGGGHVIEGNGKRKVQRYRKPTREEGVERMVVFPSVDSGKDIITLKTRILTNPPAYRMCTEVNGSNLI